MPGLVSVVVPTLDESAAIAPLLERLNGEADVAEIIVVDGGSGDGTPEIARQHGARVMASARGRGAQLAAGAAAARGEILLFLHADTTFPAGGVAAIVAALAASPAAPGGNFRIIFDGGSLFARWLTLFYSHIRRIGLYYGDSGIFVRRTAYAAVGGVRPLPIMEDWDLVRRLQRTGPTICIPAPPLITSSRKFAGRHPLAIIAGWIVIHLLYFLGVSPARLARLYYPPGWRGGAAKPSRRTVRAR